MRQNSVGQRIKARRKELGLSVDEIADKLGKDRSTVYRYEGDDIENLPISVLPPLAKILGVSPTYLLGWPDSAPARRVPILGSIAAGDPMMVAEEHVQYGEYGEYMDVGDNVRVDFCLRVRGDSMVDARICDGDVVFVRRQPTVENGEIAVVLIDDEVTLKRFYRTDNGVILKPENSKYQPLFYTEEDFKDVRILGKAVMFQSVL